LPDLNRRGGLIPAEAFAWHRELLASDGDRYDQRVRTRIEPGGQIAAADYIEVLHGRRRLIKAAARRLDGFDAALLPSVAMLPPTVDSLDRGDAAHYTERNLKALRNTSVANFLDTCAISLPTGDGPTGLMLMGKPMTDHALLAVARTVEAALAR
jgi:aspartyl-tRNA(Asn)/glutamyl-tRNA(Gln) amidotransferase subunit A